MKYKIKIDPTEPPPVKVGFKSGYVFSEVDVCENKLGYFNRLNRNYTQFLGTKTKFRLENNSLEIFDLADKVWEAYEVLRLDDKILKLALNDSVNVIYERSKYNLVPGVPFDQIVVSSSGCLGTCQINDVMVSRNGDVTFNNEGFRQRVGFFSSDITLSEFSEIEKRFRKTDLKKLKDKYEANWTDSNEITISIIQNGRIYKTIIDYGSQSPTELYWAYLPVVFLDQKLILKNLPDDAQFYIRRIFSFEKDKKLIRLAKSEGFYLASLLSKATPVDNIFVEKYTLLAFGEQGSINTTTDGRYYKISLNGKYLTVDLGYNFLERNDLLKRLSDKLYYE
ncbi:MAG: DUF6438 domain-containing protein [Dyadobacter sp.]